jgi:hypothetical protein
MAGLQLLHLLLLKVMFGCISDGLMTIKSGYYTTGKVPVTWSDESSMLFPTPGRVYV